jgi:hypothetical protein
MQPIASIALGLGPSKLRAMGISCNLQVGYTEVNRKTIDTKLAGE